MAREGLALPIGGSDVGGSGIAGPSSGIPRKHSHDDNSGAESNSEEYIHLDAELDSEQEKTAVDGYRGQGRSTPTATPRP